MFYNPPLFPFSFRGVDLSSSAGEKWTSRTLPPPPRGHINEQVAIGGDYRKKKKKKVELECVQTQGEGGVLYVCVSMFGGVEGNAERGKRETEREFVFNCNQGCCTSTKVHHYLPDRAPQALLNK